MRKALLWVGIVALAAMLFVADTMTDLEIAVAVLYVSVILISVRLGRPTTVILVGTGAVFLTVLSYALTPGGDPKVGLINCGLSLVAIAGATYLTAKIAAADIAARQAQANLAHMSRVTMMGELTASIAHEVSQPLAAIAANGNAANRWLAASPPNYDEARRAVVRIVHDAERAGEVIARVRSLMIRTPSLRDSVNVKELILETLALAGSEVRRNDILLRTDLAEDLPTLIGDRVQLQQVILNFLVNAIESMSQPGVTTRELLVSAAAEGDKVTVAVSDTGTGLPPGSMDQVFDAFYTTKSAGMGMGLAISRSIVEAHGGSIYATPNSPQGMVFGFKLPMRAEGTG